MPAPLRSSSVWVSSRKWLQVYAVRNVNPPENRFSSFTTPILASAFSISLFLIGHLVGSLQAFAQRTKSGPARVVTLAAYRVLPDLELFNLKAQAANNLPVPPGATSSAALYGIAYAAIFLVLAVAIFSRRDLK